jgi:uncharacterized protein (TIGR03435 family)
LTGLFDLELTWTPDQPPPADAPDRIVVGGVDIDLTGGVKVDPNGAGMLTALREQLGLRLESTRGPVEVLIIDRVERPTPDSASLCARWECAPRQPATSRRPG